MNTLRQILINNGALEKLNKAMKLIKEESEIADRGEFYSQTDVDYLHNGNQYLSEFYDILDQMMRSEEYANVKKR